MARDSRAPAMITPAVPELELQASRNRIDGLSRLLATAALGG